MKKGVEKKFLFFIGLVLFFVGSVNAVTVNSINGNLSHGNSVVIGGLDFGIKSPAAPLWWDNGEGAVVNNYGSYLTSGEFSWVTSTKTGSSKHYDQAGPTIQPYAYTDAFMQYRDSSFRGITPPHAYSTKWLAGGHYQWCLLNGDEPGCTGDNTPITYLDDGGTEYDDVYLHVDSGSADKNSWYGSWYYRVDPLSAIHLNYANNHKMDVLNKGPTFYDSAGFHYTVYEQALAPTATTGENKMDSMGGSCPTWADWYSGSAPLNPYVSNPRSDWIKYEHISFSSSSAGNKIVRVNNEIADQARDESLCANWFSNSQSFTVGGYWRWMTISGSSANQYMRGDRDTYRYFDDVYIDSTRARVILANNQDYDSATIIEPQIPSTWSGSSINVTVNLGALTGNTAYLFVFDSNNNHNAVGYPVTIGGTTTDTIPPVRSNGAPTGTLASGTTQATLSLTAVDPSGVSGCRYSTTAGTSYASMSGALTNSGGDTYSASVSVSDGNSYVYYVRCIDSLGNANANDYSISFSVASASSCGAADNNPADGVVSTSELLSFISLWKGESVSLGELLSGIGEWKNGC